MLPERGGAESQPRQPAAIQCAPSHPANLLAGHLPAAGLRHSRAPPKGIRYAVRRQLVSRR